MSNQYFTLPRLFVQEDLSQDISLSLVDGQAHYLRTVMRRQADDFIRVFNARDGEWLVQICEVKKKEIIGTVTQQIALQPVAGRRVHLLFSPLKKNRMDILIEKVVELGVTDIHPVLTQRSDVRKINAERLRAQILEAAEQCERFTIPVLHEMQQLPSALSNIASARVYACLERGDDVHIHDLDMADDMAFLIGPAGGFDDDEMKFLTANAAVKTISLGKTIYRAETAAIICLVHAQKS